MIFYTADLHFFHYNILQYSGRPFRSVEAMHKAFINNWNKKVSKSDEVYIIGDVSMLDKGSIFKLKPIMDALNGKKHLIYGNHDVCTPAVYVEHIGFSSTHYPFLEVAGKVLVHDPGKASGIVSKGIVLAGHVHNNQGINPIVTSCSTKDLTVINVGVDIPLWQYAPVSDEEIEKFLQMERSSAYEVTLTGIE